MRAPRPLHCWASTPARRSSSRLFSVASSASTSSRGPATRARTAGKSCCRHRMRRRSGTGSRPPALSSADSARAIRLRLEAGMNLYGNDMDENVSPLESGLTWTVAFDPADRNFVGRAALEAQRKAGVPRKLVGLILEERGVLRSHQKVVAPALAKASSRAARSHRRWSARSASRAYRPQQANKSKSISAASCCRRVS